MHRRTSSPKSYLAGLLIVLVAVAAFGIYQTLDHAPALVPLDIATGQSTPVPATGTPIAPAATVDRPKLRVVSEKVQLAAEIVEVYFAKDDNWDLTFLEDRAGHLQGTADLGQGRNYVLAGHVELKDGRSGPFVTIHKLQPGDLVTIIRSTAQNSAVLPYTVTAVAEVSADAFQVIRNHGFEELTLVTCKDWDANLGVYQKRIVVHARPAGAVATKTAPAPSKAPLRPTLRRTP